MKTLIIIPARGGSKGLKRKNIKIFDGKPLIAWSIETSQKAHIDLVVVSTEDKEIAEISKKYGCDVCIRPVSLAQDDSSIYDTILYTLDTLSESFDVVVLCEPTKPLREVRDIRTAIQIIESGFASSVVSVVKAENNNPDNFFQINSKHLIEGNNYDLKQRQQASTIYYPEGTIYASLVSTLRKEKSFYHSDTYAYVVGKWKSIEIDELCDFVAAEAIHKKYVSDNFYLPDDEGLTTAHAKNRKYGI